MRVRTKGYVMLLAKWAEELRRSAERKVARWQSAAFAMLLLSIVLWLSGCLTTTKIHRWESALLGWARKGDAQCVESAKVASRYLVNANRTLQGATSALDLATDGEAQKLMQDAARKCGEVVP